MVRTRRGGRPRRWTWWPAGAGSASSIETQDAVDRAAGLAGRPLSRIYVGLNDLRIDRRLRPSCSARWSTAPWTPSARQVAQPFGVGGLTLPGGGFPVSSDLLAAELVRPGADFTFLRRSFTADMAGRDPFVEVPRLLEAVATGCARGAGRGGRRAARPVRGRRRRGRRGRRSWTRWRCRREGARHRRRRLRRAAPGRPAGGRRLGRRRAHPGATSTSPIPAAGGGRGAGRRPRRRLLPRRRAGQGDGGRAGRDGRGQHQPLAGRRAARPVPRGRPARAPRPSTPRPRARWPRTRPSSRAASSAPPRPPARCCCRRPPPSAGCAPAVLRAFQVYGPGDHPTRLVPVVLAAARTGDAVPLPARLSRRDWVWVGDVVDACVRAAVDDALPPGRRAQHRHRRADQHRGARRHRRAGDRPADRAPSPAPTRAAPGTPPTGSATRRAAARLLGWTPTVDLAEGLARTWAGVVTGGSPSSCRCTATRPTLRPLAARLAAALDGRDWRLRLVIDASPDDSAAVAPRARRRGPADRGDRADGQRRPAPRRWPAGWPTSPTPTPGCASTPTCRTRRRPCRCCSTGWRRGDVGAVFAGRRGAYESPVRRLTGDAAPPGRRRG